MTFNRIGQSNIDLSVKRIKDFYFFVNEKLFIPDPSKIIKIELGQALGFNLSMNFINFTLRIFLHYTDTPEVILADLQVENIFQVSDLKKFETQDKLIILPKDLITAIVGMSLSHGRALLFKNMTGTVFEEVILPVTYADDVTKHFFPYMFDEEATLMQTDDKGNVRAKGIVNSKKKKVKL